MQMNLLYAVVISNLASCTAQVLAQQTPVTMTGSSEPLHTGATMEPISIVPPHASGLMDGESYTVASGDYLSSIAARAGVGLIELASWNLIDSPYTIYPGQQLRLSPPPSASVSPQKRLAKQAIALKDVTPKGATIEHAPAAPHAKGFMNDDFYTVASGDYLYAIAARAGVSLKELARWNSIDPPYKIYSGQRLRLSPSPADGSSITAVSSGVSPELVCAADGCRTGDGLLFQLRTRSYDEPLTVGTSKQSSSEELQPDRRVAIGLEKPGRAVAQGRFSVSLPDNGVIWATEDPTLGRRDLSVSAPTMVPFENGAITRPVRFFVRSNYSSFVSRMELAVFRSTDVDLISPLAKVAVDVAPVAEAQWDSALPRDIPFRVGDELVYVLRAFDVEGHVDETYPQRLQLVRPDEAERSQQLLRSSTERSFGSALSEEEAETQRLIDDVFDESNLRYQNIPIYGSRVRIQGRNIPAAHTLWINGDSYPVDLERKFVAEYLMPVGQYRFDVRLEGPGGSVVERELPIEVSGRYFFGVGIADVTVRENRASGPGRDLVLDGRDDDLLSDGRLAFYLKAKTKGKYLITAQADTQDRPLEDLFDGFTQADPQDVFRRLDPDLYYPTYGDDSTTSRDVDTMGRFYLRAEWDKNEALWGNYYTGITGTEYAQYGRSLYGAGLNWRSSSANPWGDADTELRVFGSEAQTAPGHSEFIGTGGSLYYLRHTDVLPGSDHVVLEVRDPGTGLVERRIELQRGADYEIDELQGRILLTRALSQITRENIPFITRDTPLDGFEQRLLVDYEWVPSGFDADEVTGGVRAKHWFGDHVGIGLTYIDENRAGEDYTLMGADLTQQFGKGTYLKFEHSRTESTIAPVFFSDNGGLSFSRLNPDGLREGVASSVESRVNFRELGWTEQEWSAATWWRQVDGGYSISRHDTGLDIEEHGAELLGHFNPGLGINARYSEAERDGETLAQAHLNSELRIGDNSALSAEVRGIEEQRREGDATGLLGALRYSHRFGTSLDVSGTTQMTLSNDGGDYADNDAYSLAARYNFANLSTLGTEITTGDRGDAATLNGEYRLTSQHSFYGGYTYSTDSTEYDSLFNPNRQNGWTFGQRWRLSNQVNLFNESQHIRSRDESGLAHTFGMDFYPAIGWNLGLILSDGELTNSIGEEVSRNAVSLTGGRTSPETDWQSKLEWRRDSGAERRTQWVSTHRLSHKLNESWRIAARFNYADTEDELNSSEGAKFIEGNAGFAYRPWSNSRWGLFGRYTYLYDLASPGQLGEVDYDQKTQVLAFEGVYRLDHHWELAAKLARREGEVRFGRNTGDWLDSSTTFAAGQVRFEFYQNWHALAEYRWLNVDNGGTRQGFLAGVDRDIGKNIRIGAGYNFTEFSDDLTNFDYDHKGWFVNFTARY
ncbi:LysM peptidoglycan-binding domain-containing protein [Microbulbifer sp. TRSA001]|uniref:LysM peptidoglycan-binding domain-containing protein n=1 Tax=Microbulbifer sp. TRSA001 TaxID=3243381 RepID=UPI00403932DE